MAQTKEFFVWIEKDERKGNEKKGGTWPIRARSKKDEIWKELT